MPEWDAEIVVHEPLVRRVLSTQFPTLADASVTPLAEGWDNTVWLVDGRFVFRFPRRAIAVPALERELAVLPALASRLPLPIPRPVHVGRPTETFPWPFFGAAYLPGSEIAELRGRRRYDVLGASLGRFLRALHAPDTLRAVGDRLVRDPLRRSDMAYRVPLVRDRLDALAALGVWRPRRAVDALLDTARSLPPPTDLVVVHGDLHVRHVLVAADGEPTAVIDWGDVAVGDRSIDLSLYWSVLDEGGRRAFAAAYGSVTPASLLRARVLALMLNAMLALYAHDVGERALLDETLAGLDRAVAG